MIISGFRCTFHTVIIQVPYFYCIFISYVLFIIKSQMHYLNANVFKPTSMNFSRKKNSDTNCCMKIRHLGFNSCIKIIMNNKENMKRFHIKSTLKLN